ncbi:MAG: ABC transporter ATP-binding protein [Gammaproteobacteria bacterium]|nr:ABC transporter ATP-binding protein [Gammaproteobacteria bacterium]MDH4255368.1 ABC transporter ATP-binding protein [Gammaproteobacteria bacterium]MDH5309551.1 ABC transporter ATP-binding protein [Gammaproteobacteria bacterium]
MARSDRSGDIILSTRNVTKRYGQVEAVRELTLEIRDGEFFTIVGPSGSGKSTLIRMLGGLEAPTTGSVWLRDEDITHVPANRRPTCMVFQSLALFRHRSVGENIEFAQKMRGVPPGERRRHALEMMRIVRLPDSYYNRRIHQCSGGEQQRVALARALASDPTILFFDEPLSAIDYRLRKILEVEMKDLHRRTGKTFVYITHSLEEAMVMSDRISIMRDGNIVQTGTPRDIYSRPGSRFVAQFMGEVNVFEIREGRIASPEADVSAIGRHGYLVLRPEHLRRLDGQDAADVRFEAIVESEYMLGSRLQYHLRAGDASLVAEIPIPAATGVTPGITARWGFDLADATLTED